MNKSKENGNESPFASGPSYNELLAEREIKVLAQRRLDALADAGVAFSWQTGPHRQETMSVRIPRPGHHGLPGPANVIGPQRCNSLYQAAWIAYREAVRRKWIKPEIELIEDRW